MGKKTRIIVHKEEPFKRSPITQMLVDLLNLVDEGEFISYSDLSREVHCDTQLKQRYYLYNALRILQKEHGKLFRVERNAGLVRLENTEPLCTESA